MRVAILGATSHIAKDLVLSFAARSSDELSLFARRPSMVTEWLEFVGLSNQCVVADFGAFGPELQFDAIINFVGAGAPAQISIIGASIFDITLKYDDMALDYVRQHPECKYLFLSSGAAYGSDFAKPASDSTKAVIPINALQPQDWYGVAKLHAEGRHRSLSHLQIVDLRVFSYFSRTQDLTAGFLITDILRAVSSRVVLKISPTYIVRDYLHPSDFYQLIHSLLAASTVAGVVDCYTLAPIDKVLLLDAMAKTFDLRFEIID